MRNDQVADRILVDDAACVANDMCIAGLQAEQILDVDPRVHARDDRKLLRRLDLLLRPAATVSVGRVIACVRDRS